MRANSQISIRHEGKIAILDITGYLTDASEPILSKAYADVEVQNAEKVLLNFERRSFITSSGFGEIIRLLWKMRDKGQTLRVAPPSTQVRNILIPSGLHRVSVFLNPKRRRWKISNRFFLRCGFRLSSREEGVHIHI